ncbi:MAG: hydroxyacylglutathione hydrolase [Synechococcales cyanobacterium CRU_2_2]|nr:hydroxyacylglutathione hydrolase [Synechococcales cyanobacterium CRU_2_2]
MFPGPQIERLQIERIPVLSDNYIFLLYDPARQIMAVVDPAEATPVLARAQQLGAELVAIFNTHHHHDHVGGNREILQQFPQAVVYAGAEDRGRIPGQQVFLETGDRVLFGSREAEVFFIPGHTRGHIAYYFPPIATDEAGQLSGDLSGDLFCGDTIFSGGCGRLREGTPAQMVDSIGRLRSLPDNTRIWCAHEYTLSNLQFSLTVEPGNAALMQRFEQVKAMRSRQEPTVPTTMAIEKATNPFLRWDQPGVIAAIGKDTPARTFGKLRGKKDLFRG